METMSAEMTDEEMQQFFHLDPPPTMSSCGSPARLVDDELDLPPPITATLEVGLSLRPHSSIEDRSLSFVDSGLLILGRQKRLCSDDRRARSSFQSAIEQGRLETGGYSPASSDGCRAATIALGELSQVWYRRTQTRLKQLEILATRCHRSTSSKFTRYHHQRCQFDSSGRPCLSSICAKAVVRLGRAAARLSISRTPADEADLWLCEDLGRADSRLRSRTHRVPSSTFSRQDPAGRIRLWNSPIGNWISTRNTQRHPGTISFVLDGVLCFISSFSYNKQCFYSISSINTKRLGMRCYYWKSK